MGCLLEDMLNDSDVVSMEGRWQLFEVKWQVPRACRRYRTGDLMGARIDGTCRHGLRHCKEQVERTRMLRGH